MDNTVGSISTDFCNLQILNEERAYIVGLWCADGYHRTSSIGLSNTNTDLIEKFSDFLLKFFPQERIKIRTYNPDLKRRKKAYHLYVNCRPLLRRFQEFRSNIREFIEKDLTLPYMAGRFDGDGSVAKDFYSDCRIVYGNLKEAENDFELMKKISFQKMKIYNYQSSKTFCLYFSRFETNKFLSSIYPYSLRLQKSVFIPRRDLIS